MTTRAATQRAPHGDADIAATMAAMGTAARAAAAALAQTPHDARCAALLAMARLLRRGAPQIIAANHADIAAAAEAKGGAYIDRLRVDAARIEGMAAGIEAVAALPDPLGRVLEQRNRPNGLVIEKVAVPLGVVGMIYESRPNVGADAGALCVKSGNAVVLRGGSDALRTGAVIAERLVAGLAEAGLPEAAIQFVTTPDRDAVGHMLAGLGGAVDVIIPRGGKSLVARVQAEARVPVFAHLDGNNHVYVDAAADLEMARAVLLNAKLRRTSVCGAAETLLVDAAAPPGLLPALLGALLDAGCAVRGDAACRRADARVTPATDADWDTEFLDAVIAARVVAGVDGAIAHIARHGSHHTDAIVTRDEATAARFLAGVDSAIVLHNASTQFADGGEFGMGAEIGIATGRFHARGPVGAAELTTFKYIVRGTGQTRPA